MSISLRDLIRAVRACKTAAEEREVVAKEGAALREAFRDQDQRYRHRNVAKLMYIHMLGYPTHFGQMETLKLIAANGFAEKRIGYLGLMILLDERQEVLMLVTNSLKLDLNHKNQYIIGLALVSLGNICSAEMSRDLAPDVEKLLETNNSYIRKKAALCAIRICKKVPDLADVFTDRVPELLSDKNHSVILAGVSLMSTICELDGTAIAKYRKHVPALCKILKNLLQSGFSPEHDVGGITDPFLQVKLLRLMRVLAAGDVETSDVMSDILAQVATNIEGNRNAGNAILYECVTTIMGIEAASGLRVLAVNILGRFLANKDNNIRYVALNTLARVVAVDTQAVQRHRATIVDCVKDADVSIRRRALELVYSLVNENNIRTLTKELLEYVAISDTEFKPDLTARICTLIQRYAPDKRWQVDSLVAVMVQAGAYVKEEVCRALIVLITNAPDMHAYAVRSLFRALRDNLDEADLALMLTALWCVGEFGELLLAGQGGTLMEGEPALNVSETDVVHLLETLVKRRAAEASVREYTLMAAMKLTARLPSQLPRLRALIERFKNSSLLEVQARSCEFSQVFGFDKMRAGLVERMPALDEAEYAHNLGTAAKPAATSPSPGAPATTAPAAVAAGDNDLLGGFDLMAGLDAAFGGSSAVTGSGTTAAAATAAAPAKSAFDALEDLLGVSPGPAVVAAAAPVAARSSGGGAAAAVYGGDLMDLLGGPPVAATAGKPADPLDSLLQTQPASTPSAPLPVAPTRLSSGGGAPHAPPAVAVPPGSVTFPNITVYQRNGVLITFQFVKRPEAPAETHVLATYTNTGPTPVTDFALQAAVPKFMNIHLDAATASTLSPNATNAATQHIAVQNTMHGLKPLALRLRIVYTLGGQAVQEMVEVANMPAGL